MVVKITAKRQVTFPVHVLEALGVRAGDRLELVASDAGYLIRPRRLARERLAPLRGELREGAGAFELEAFREEQHDPALRD